MNEVDEITIKKNRIKNFADRVLHKCPKCEKEGVDTDYNPYIDDDGTEHIDCPKCKFRPVLSEDEFFQLIYDVE